MNCPTCGLDFESVEVGDGFVWYCWRCGTLVASELHVPKLVERCLEFEKEFAPESHDEPNLGTWKECGIHECIHKKESQL